MTQFFASFTVSTSAAAGIPSAGFSGTASGVAQAVLASKNAATVLSEKSGQRDSILQALQILFNDPTEMKHDVLKTYLKELRGGLIATNNSIEWITRYLSLVMVSGMSHLAQIPSDAATLVRETAKGLSKVEIPGDELKEASTKAFTFDPKEQKPSASVDKVADLVSNQGGQIIDKVHKAINLNNNSHARTHAKTAASTGAGGTVTATAIMPSAAALLTNMIGQIAREASAVSHFLKRSRRARRMTKMYIMQADR